MASMVCDAEGKKTVSKAWKLGSGSSSKNLLQDLEEVTKLPAPVSFSFNGISDMMISRSFPY